MKPTLQEVRATLMLLAAAATSFSPEVGTLVQENAEAVAATVTGAWGLVAGWQSWRKRRGKA